MRRNVAIAILMLLVSGTAAFAQMHEGCPRNKAMGQPALAPKDVPGPGPMPMGMMGIPDLTPQQLDKIDDLRIEHIKEIAGFRTDLQLRQIELARLWRADKLDGNKLVAKIREINELRGKIQVAKVNHHLAIYNLLTPEQRKFFRPPMMDGPDMPGMGPGRMMGRGRGQMCGGGGCGNCGNDD